MNHTTTYTDKYPSMSPYAYCAWNPVNITDPNGDTIRPANGSSPEFIAYFNTAVQYLKDNGADDVYSKLHSNPTNIYVTELSFDDAVNTAYIKSTKTIEWCPTARYTSDNIMMSPSTILEHEMDHALQSILNPEQMANDAKKEVFGYGNKEEERVITGSEQRTACKLGEISDGQFTRKNHFGRLYETISPTSTTLKNPSQQLTPPQSTTLNEVRITSHRP